MASAQIRHFYNTPTTISSTTTTTRQLLQQQKHTSKRKQFQNDTFLWHPQIQSASVAATSTEAVGGGATPWPETTIGAAAATPGNATAATSKPATDDAPASATTKWPRRTSDEIVTKHPRMQLPLASSSVAATCNIAAAIATEQQQCIATTVAATTGISEQDCRPTTSTCLSRLSSKVSQDSTNQQKQQQPQPKQQPAQRRLLQQQDAARDSDASTSTNPGVGIFTDMQKFARSIFPLVIIFNLLPLFYAGEFSSVTSPKNKK